MICEMPSRADQPPSSHGLTAPPRSGGTPARRDCLACAANVLLLLAAPLVSASALAGEPPIDTRHPRGQCSGTGSDRNGGGPVRPLRNSDRRHRPDDAALAARGIHRFESRRLILYTDIPADQAQPLPPLMDAAFDAWEQYFGSLPIDREESEYQLTGYLMADQGPFRDSGVLPGDLPAFDHGRHRGQEFWLNDQPTAYYREHLLLHEGTHCFMTSLEHGLLRHTWYMEGMAELFGTHQRLKEDRGFEFRVLPGDRGAFPGLGRIRLIESVVARRPPPTLQSILDFPPERYSQPEAYAWSWALCQFLDGHPRHAAAFRKASRSVVTGGPDAELRRLLAEPAIGREWVWFAGDLCHAYDQSRAAVEVVEGTDLPAGETATVTIRADRGWQSSGVRIRAGAKCRMQARGRFVVARDPRDWVSEAQGISLRYFGGRPLGRLLARVWPDDPASDGDREIHDPGREGEFTPAITGTLYLRLNDASSELADNQGEIEVSIRQDE